MTLEHLHTQCFSRVARLSKNGCLVCTFALGESVSQSVGIIEFAIFNSMAQDESRLSINELLGIEYLLFQRSATILSSVSLRDS